MGSIILSCYLHPVETLPTVAQAGSIAEPPSNPSTSTTLYVLDFVIPGVSAYYVTIIMGYNKSFVQNSTAMSFYIVLTVMRVRSESSCVAIDSSLC